MSALPSAKKKKPYLKDKVLFPVFILSNIILTFSKKVFLRINFKKVISLFKILELSSPIIRLYYNVLIGKCFFS